MARKNVFETSDAGQPSVPQARSPLAQSRPLLGLERPSRQTGPVGALSQSLDSINERAKRAEAIEHQLSAGLAVVELDPSSVDSSFISDRIAVTSEDEQSLVESIREHGQQVPILVRPHPSSVGRFQVAYGHRRLKAAQALAVPVKAVVRTLSDDQLVVAQGQENNARTNLSFIERARFAAQLEDRKFSREVIMSALNVDKAALSRMIALIARLPSNIVEAIGPAPSYGRQRWQEFAEQLGESRRRARIATLLASEEVLRLGSDQRFEAAFNALKEKSTRQRSESWSAGDGTRPVRIMESELRLTLAFDKRVDANFGHFVQERLQQLYDEFRRQAKAG